MSLKSAETFGLIFFVGISAGNDGRHVVRQIFIADSTDLVDGLDKAVKKVIRFLV
ncbi:hypothetical protein [Merdibacter massiliensis]|uniref:hypothetical protein n=1 Tax=Merdibacter massiliensis TaxID=1871030 RepID=UPI001F1B5A58|nr:hypothetical protein [Merdibacter massiliensis]